MRHYRHSRKNTQTFLSALYADGLKPGTVLGVKAIEEQVRTIGIFRFKGYLYAFHDRRDQHSIDDVLSLYYMDKFLTRHILELSASVETLLKARVAEIAYTWTGNPFFYLLRRNHAYANFRINKPTLENWKNRNPKDGEADEQYLHYGLYYKSRYCFDDNRSLYLDGETIELHEGVNYPPFHYLVESATLGALITLIRSLKVGRYSLLHAVAKSFGINPRLFPHYLDRLNEIRNRAAHQERLFNRGYRSVRAFGHYQYLRRTLNPHSFADVYLYFYFMLGRIDRYEDFDAFFRKEIAVLFDAYREDHLIALDSGGLNRKMYDEDFRKIRTFMLAGMGIKKASHSKVT